ncbi:MAG: DapH/DapD/GlmU-related protein [bacterium]|nr:DapH/DapD/GlmU-related protein [bacterium]
MNKFAPEKFFDLSAISFADIFENIENVWEVIPKIKTYIEKLKGEKPFIGKGTVIKDNVVFEGPCIIGDNCIIGPNAYLRDGVIIGDNVIVGFSCEVKSSIVLNNTFMKHLSYVGNSIIGSNVNLATGVVCANFRFDGKNVDVRDGENKINTNLEKFGCVIGDRTKTGVNSILNPGTIIGKNSIIWPLVDVYGTHKDNEVIK